MSSNPYSTPISTDEFLGNVWSDRKITISARFPRKLLWLFAEVLVQVDGVLAADSIFLWTFDKDLVFQFEHQGRRVPCRMRTRQCLGTARRLMVDLSIDNGPVVSHRVPIEGVLPNLLALVLVIVLAALSGLFWLCLYALS